MFVKVNLTFKLIAVAFIFTIIYVYVSRDIYGETFVNEIRIADRDNILTELADQELIELGKEICIKSNTWKNLNSSNTDIAKVILKTIPTEKDAASIVQSSSILTFLRYQSIYELCPENIHILSKLIKKEQDIG